MTDEQIVDLFFQRSEKAISETETAYGRYFHYIAYGILRDEEDAKEIVNDAYLKAWNSIPPERPNPLKGFIGISLASLPSTVWNGTLPKSEADANIVHCLMSWKNVFLTAKVQILQNK